MRRSSLHRLLYTIVGAVLVWLTMRLTSNATTIIVVACPVCLFIAVRLYRFDYLHPSLVYLLPWLMILVFSVVPMSSYARPIQPQTYTVLIADLFAWLFACAFSGGTGISSTDPAPDACGKVAPAEFGPRFERIITAGFVFLYAFAAVNVMMAGYVPLVSLITTGDSGYWDFGVKSVYGAFLAYANALGCMAFYIYIRSGRRKYLFLFLSVLAMHLAFMTRQNIATLLVEVFVIRSLAVKRFSRLTMGLAVMIALVAFSALGTLRSGDIRAIVQIQHEYEWVPTSAVWLYAYSYFNALNLDNTIAESGAPYFDGSMWQSLLPSVLRPETDHGTYLEVDNMNVSSYVAPTYVDIGNWVVGWTVLVGLATVIAYRRAVVLRRFVDIASYSCLYFCALLSFFVDCWLYLPIISQLFFFWIFHVLMVRSKRIPHLRPIRAY